MLRLVFVFLVWTGTSLLSAAAEYFGEFSNDAVGRFISGGDPDYYELMEEITFTDPNGFTWPVPAGIKVDGASIPQYLWSIVGHPFTSTYIRPSIVHDYYCNKRNRTTNETNRIFYYGLRAEGVDEWTASQMLWAVEAYGPKWTIETRPVERQECTSIDGATSCITIIANELISTSVESLDFDDPLIRTLAEAKFVAISRTLRATDGFQLDVGVNGAIRGDVNSIVDNAAFVRTLLMSKDYDEITQNIGLLSAWTEKGGTLPPGTFVPGYSATQEIQAWLSQEDKQPYFRVSKETLDDLTALGVWSFGE